MNDSDRKPRPAEGEPSRTPRAERRQTNRHALRDVRAIMSWDEGGEHVTAEGEVLNISGGGAAVLAAARAPLAGLPVELKLECRSRNLGVSGSPIARSLRRPFRHAVRPLAVHPLDRARRGPRTPSRTPPLAALPRSRERARLTWTDDAVPKSRSPALLNISGGGAALIVSDPPPADEPLWLELYTIGTSIDPVESRLVVVCIDPSGLIVARIKFIELCSRLLFESAVHGAI